MGRIKGIGRNRVDLSSLPGLEKLASKQELDAPKPNKIISGLRTVGGILNIGTAAVAGATRGLIREDTSILEGIAEGVKNRETFGFSNIIKEDLGINPDNGFDKFLVGTAGFAADVLFDPLTYLSLGTATGSKALKVGSKTLSSSGRKIAQKASREVIETGAERLLARGAGKTGIGQANKIASKRASGIINDLLQRSIGKKGLTKDAFKQFLDEGIDIGTLETLQQLGPKLLDKGGIKMFGKTLISSKQLAKTPLGKVAKKLGESEIATALKNTLGKTFVSDFGKNPKLVSIIDKAGIEGGTAIKKIVENNEELFKKLNDNEMSELFKAVFEKKEQILSKQKEIQTGAIKELQGKFPNIKFDDPKKAGNFLSSLENATGRRTNTLQKSLGKFETKIKNLRKKRVIKLENKKSLIDGVISKNIGKKTAVLQESLEKLLKKDIGEQTKDLQEIIDTLKSSIVSDSGERVLKEGGKEVGKEEFDDIIKSIVMPKRDEMNLLIKELEQEVLDSSGKEFLKKPLLAGLKLTKEQVASKTQKKIVEVQNSFTDLVNKAENEINKRINDVREKLAQKLEVKQKAVSSELIKLQNDLTDKGGQLGRIMGARREAKAIQKGEKLLFDNPKIQEVSDKLFEGDKSIVKRFQEAAGLSEEDAMKFYVPSLFEDKLKISDFAFGRNIGSPTQNYLKEFKGSTKGIIKDPFEAYTRGQVNIVNDRIKDKAFRSTVTNLGKPLQDFTEKEAREFGMKKVGRQGFDGKRLEAWFPEEVADELNKFMEPKLKPIDELARNTGYDWATGLFKSYVTTLFPGFHVRNITSNQFNNMLKIGLDVLNPKLQIHGASIAMGKNLDTAIKTKTGKIIKLGDIRKKVLKESDILDNGGAFGSFERMIDESKGKITTKRGIPNLNPLSRENIAFQTGQKIGNFSEQQAKMTSVLSAVMQGKTVKEGIEQAEEALFNYSKLTDFETSVMRRIIPFYTFGRKNFELQLKALAKTPGKIASQLKFFRGASDAIGEQITQEDMDSLPSWVLEGLGIKAGAKENGNQLMYTGFGLPIEEFLGRFSGENGIPWNFTKELLISTNPIIKFPLEKATGEDFFRGRPIAEIDNAQSISGLLNILPDKVSKEFKDLIEFREIVKPKYVDGKVDGTVKSYTANPFALHWFRNLPTSRIASTAGFLADEKEPVNVKLLKFFTGVKGFEIDKEKQKFINDMKRKEELQIWLLRMGVIGKKDIVFEKKQLK